MADDSELTVPEDGSSTTSQSKGEASDSATAVCGRAVERLLMPDENGMVKKEKLVEFFQKTVGSMFTDVKASEVLEELESDENGMVRLDCFMKAFADKYCTQETLAGIVELLESNPEKVESAWDWKSMLSNAGLELSDSDLREAVQAAKNLAEVLLTHQAGRKVGGGEEGEDTDGGRGQLFQAVKEKLHLMGLGEGCEKNVDGEERPKSE